MKNHGFYEFLHSVNKFRALTMPANAETTIKQNITVN